ncbi:hypothetical protein [Candidatus Lokiarchaeum ossiferum]|uniref:hypothetical protein n=1 Tax=Candidatus Lokiarchaeum ossiferum TaxID=2951803 RepID=UPI00352E1375
MSTNIKKVNIICPTCSKSKKIAAPVDIIKKKETGATSVYIPSGMVCEHEFYAYIDKNFAVRDYLVLEFSLQDEAKKANKIKNDALTKADSVNLDMKNVLKFISEKDLRSLIYACYIESHLVLIENDPSQERFVVIFNLLAKLFPDIIETTNIFTPERYLEFSENQKERLQNHTVFNVIYNLSVYKPFGDSDAEPLETIMKLLMKGSIKLQAIYTKNYIDYLRKFSDDIKDMENEKIDKVIKFLKKSDEQHQEMFTSAMIGVMRRRNEFKITHLSVEDSSEEDIMKMIHKKLEGKLFLYNEKTHIRQAENLPDVTEKHTLRLLRKNGNMSIDKIISELQNIARDRLLTFELHKLPEILEGFTKKGFIETL